MEDEKKERRRPNGMAGKRKKRRLRPNNEAEVELYCEWEACPQPMFTDLCSFLSHLRVHGREVVATRDQAKEQEERAGPGPEAGGEQEVRVKEEATEKEEDEEVDERATDDQDGEGEEVVLETGFTCQWQGCGESSFGSSAEFFLHLSYHGFHSKLMAWGILEMNYLNEEYNKAAVCSMDTTSRTVLPELPAQFTCHWRDCDTNFEDTECFYRHVDTHASDNIPIPSLSKEELKRTKFAKCDWIDCESSFVTRSHLKEHLRTHTQEKLIACPNCGAMFCNRTKFSDHIMRQISSTSEMESLTLLVTTEENNEQVSLLTVQVPCQSTCTGTSIGINGDFSDTDNGASGDGSLLEADGLLNEDIVTLATVAAAVSQCNEHVLAGYAPSLDHLKRTPEGNFKCPECEADFPTKSLIREHFRRHFHNYQCDICGKSVDSPSSLSRHMDYRHSNERPFACQFCDAKFKSRSDLRRHIDIHKEDNPFKCSLCDFEARCCHTLRRHQKQAHQNQNSVFVCHECCQKFTRGNNLTRHLVTKHQYKLPSSKSRHQYVRQQDGTYRLKGNL